MENKEKDLSPEKTAMEIEKEVMKLYRVLPGDNEKQMEWVKKYGKLYRDIFDKNQKAFMDIYRNRQSRGDLPQIIKMAMDGEK